MNTMNKAIGLACVAITIEGQPLSAGDVDAVPILSVAPVYTDLGFGAYSVEHPDGSLEVFTPVYLGVGVGAYLSL